MGVFVDVCAVSPDLRCDYKLFSESNTRWVVEVRREDAGRFEALMGTCGVGIVKIGDTIKEKRVGIRDNGNELVDVSVEAVRAAWSGKVC